MTCVDLYKDPRHMRESQTSSRSRGKHTYLVGQRALSSDASDTDVERERERL